MDIQANNTNQPCSSFGVHENLTEVKSLYDQGDLIFIANAGLLAKPVTTANYSGETPVQLFAHNSMQYDTARVDMFKEFAETGEVKLCSIVSHTFQPLLIFASECASCPVLYLGVGGRMADLFTQAGVPTNLFSTQYILSSSGLTSFNSNPSIMNMNDVIKAINNDTTADSGFHAETWSSKLTESLDRQRSLKENVDMTNVTTIFPTDSDISSQLKLVTRIMQTRVSRGVKRDIFYVQDGGYNTHGEFVAIVDHPPTICYVSHLLSRLTFINGIALHLCSFGR